ncbi:MAG: FKBP-type peptidyl-prolyl cis-trans isomerase [Bacteroidaceae bacterium]|nr:FKBP-type peptidyl-prolyl cis-trans isomerase [Bacteroidaceae bacterium]
MKKNLLSLIALVCIVGLTSCSEEITEWDPYYNWETRNSLWFEQAADSARTAISEAKALYGDAWEEHCEWRMFKSLQRSAELQGSLTDSIVCKIVKKGYGTEKINFTDYVLLHYRGWLMPSEYIAEDNANKETKMIVFSQTYYGEFNPATAAPIQLYVGGSTEGFQTALQYMVEGDEWYVYIPQQLAYKDEASGSVPAYSTLLFLMNVVGVYEKESDIPDWK